MVSPPMDDGLSSKEQHVVWPDLVRVDHDDDTFTLYNPGHGTSLDVAEESRDLVEAVLAGFVKPTAPGTFLQKHRDVPRELLVLMARSGILVRPSELAFLEHGFLKPAAQPIGASWSWSDLPEAAQPGTWVT